MVTTIIISVVLCFIFILLLSINNNLLINRNNLIEQKPTENNDPNIIKIPKEFLKGIDHAWNLMQVALYKVCEEEGFIMLDFKSIVKEIHNNMNLMANNTEELKKWTQKFQEFVKADNSDQENNHL